MVYILYSGITKHDTLFKHKANNILEGSNTFTSDLQSDPGIEWT